MTDKNTNYPQARLIEVFSAIQGEGFNVGTRQIFIRFAICDLRCHFCDSAHTWTTPSLCSIEQTPGKRDFVTYPNPVSLPMLLEWVEQQNQPGLHDSISLTGGEPLLHAPFLAEFLPQVKKSTGLPIYLETGGHRPEQLAMVLPYLDSVGMDIKLPSVSGENHWQAHTEFLQYCHNSQVEVFMKIIISSQTDPAELEQAAKLVADVNPEILVFLQPVTPLGSGLANHLSFMVDAQSLNNNQELSPSKQSNQPPMLPPTPDQVLVWQSLMKRFLKRVRVVPQTHKMIAQL